MQRRSEAVFREVEGRVTEFVRRSRGRCVSVAMYSLFSDMERRERAVIALLLDTMLRFTGDGVDHVEYAKGARGSRWTLCGRNNSLVVAAVEQRFLTARWFAELVGVDPMDVYALWRVSKRSVATFVAPDDRDVISRVAGIFRPGAPVFRLVHLWRMANGVDYNVNVRDVVSSTLRTYIGRSRVLFDVHVPNAITQTRNDLAARVLNAAAVWYVLEFAGIEKNWVGSDQ